jgi:hypothetical protein
MLNCIPTVARRLVVDVLAAAATLAVLGVATQAWLKNASGNLVPVGTFNLANQVTLWAGVAPTKGFTTLTITQQQASHNTASTHQVVLKGTAHRIH